MHAPRLAVATILGVCAVCASGLARPAADPLAILSDAGRAEVRRGLPVVELVPASGDDIGIVGAVKTSADEARMLAWFREVEQLHGGRYVPLIGRFSPEPVSDDVAALVLGEDELEDLADCRPGRCAMKLADADITPIRAAIRTAGVNWKPAAEEAFRRVMVARARAFLATGLSGSPLIHDRRRPESPRLEFEQTVTPLAGHPLWTRELGAYLRGEHCGACTAETILYWSKDLLGDAKPIVSLSQLIIFRPAPAQPAVVCVVQFFATHYLTASISLTGLREAADGRYLVYSRRSRVDVFDGLFGGFVRSSVHRRIRAEGPPVLGGMRDKVEASLPERRRSTTR